MESVNHPVNLSRTGTRANRPDGKHSVLDSPAESPEFPVFRKVRKIRTIFMKSKWAGVAQQNVIRWVLNSELLCNWEIIVVTRELSVDVWCWRAAGQPIILLNNINCMFVLPFRPLYFRPKYRYPYYDENGKGKLLYGYGGSELYQYRSYTPLDGIH